MLIADYMFMKTRLPYRYGRDTSRPRQASYCRLERTDDNGQPAVVMKIVADFTVFRRFEATEDI